MSSRVCAYCGKTFETHAHRGKPRRFCSPACYYQHNMLESNRRKSEQRGLARHAWAEQEAKTLTSLAPQGLDKLADYVYNTYNKRKGMENEHSGIQRAKNKTTEGEQ